MRREARPLYQPVFESLSPISCCGQGNRLDVTQNRHDDATLSRVDPPASVPFSAEFPKDAYCTEFQQCKGSYIVDAD